MHVLSLERSKKIWRHNTEQDNIQLNVAHHNVGIIMVDDVIVSVWR
jgi:hypothetical protein